MSFESQKDKEKNQTLKVSSKISGLEKNKFMNFSKSKKKV